MTAERLRSRHFSGRNTDGIEADEAHEASHVFAADDLGIPEATEEEMEQDESGDQEDEEESETLGIEPVEQPKLLTRPGRNAFPPRCV